MPSAVVAGLLLVPLSPFMTTLMGDPTHRSMSSNGSSCEGIVKFVWCQLGFLTVMMLEFDAFFRKNDFHSRTGASRVDPSVA